MNKYRFLFLILLGLIIIPISVNATTYNFKEQGVRANYNQTKYNALSSIGEAKRNLYTDITLKDMHETRYLGMTEEQLLTIQELSEQILNDENYTCPDTDSENICKLRKFHDWIRDNFYYYDPGNAANASKLGLNINEYDNPYYILTKNHLTTTEGSHYIARCNGYTALLIALARNEGMPARAMEGYYNFGKRKAAQPVTWGSNIAVNTISHTWVGVYVDNKWIIIDANADCYNTYAVTKKCSYGDDGEFLGTTPNNFTDEESCDAYGYVWTNWATSQRSWVENGPNEINGYNRYFNITPYDLADTHLIFTFRLGSKSLKHLSNATEVTKLKTFLNKYWSGKYNGKRINPNYTVKDPETWFVPGDKNSMGDGTGRLYKLYWPSNKSLSGTLDLSGFTSLQNVSFPSNRVSSLTMTNVPALSTLSASNNKMTKVTVTGSKKLSLLSIQSNPTTYVKYNFGNSLRTAIIKAGGGGTISMRYSKSGNIHTHYLKAIAKKGYKFKGWYSNNKRISKSSSLTLKKSISFTYTAKFIRR